jgi:hypothetical protein
MNVFPLIYGFRELVAGAGFVAGVTVDGCALLKKEEDGWWLYGVQPGGIAERGDTEYEAYLRFKQSFREVLADSAALYESFDAFKEDLEKLAAQVNGARATEWNATRQAVRNGELKPEGTLADLPRVTADVHVGIRVIQLQRPTVKDNPAEKSLQAAA